MGKKYFDTKVDSLESSILGVWVQEAERMDGRTKDYKLHREKLEAQRIKREKLTAKQKKLDVDGDGEIEASDLAKLRAKAKKESYKTAHDMWVDALKEVLSFEEEQWIGTPGEIDEKKMSSKDKTAAKKYRSSPAGKKAAKAFAKKKSKAGYKPDKARSKASKKAAKLKSDYNPDEKSDTGKKSDKIEINPTLEDESKRK